MTVERCRLCGLSREEHDLDQRIDCPAGEGSRAVEEYARRGSRGNAPSMPEPTTAADRLVAVVKITGGSLQEIARRLEDAAYDLEVKARANCTNAEIISGWGIVTVRAEASAPLVDWRESEANRA